jgi:hypothetical protein
MLDYLGMMLAPPSRPLPQRARHGRPVVDCPRCQLTFIGAGAHQAYADHSWTHVR